MRNQLLLKKIFRFDRFVVTTSVVFLRNVRPKSLLRTFDRLLSQSPQNLQHKIKFITWIEQRKKPRICIFRSGLASRFQKQKLIPIRNHAKRGLSHLWLLNI